MPYFRDRVKDSSTTTGTGDVTLSGTAPTGYQNFNTAFGLGAAFLYCIVDPASGLWETGTGMLSASTTMVRDANVFDGSSGPGTLVSFTAGTKDVFCIVASHWCEDVDSGSNLNQARGWAMP
jgi:hypothetical protein